MLKLYEPDITDAERAALIETLNSGWWAQGPKVAEFEQEFAAYTGFQECVAVSNGTAALWLAYKVLEAHDKAILVPSLSFISTVSMAILNRIKPVFVDINPETLTIDVEDLKANITKDTMVMAPMHYGGYPCDMKPLWELGEDHKINIVEDACHAVGSKIEPRGQFAVYSFHPVKNIASGAGGAICFNPPFTSLIRRKLEQWRWCGITPRDLTLGRYKSDYNVDDISYNFQWNDLFAVLALEQLKRLPEMQARRHVIAQAYHKAFKGLEWLDLIPYNKDCSYHLFVLKLHEGISRERFMAYMTDKGIQTGVHYPPIHRFTYFQKQYPIYLSNTEALANRIVSIPISPALNDEQIQQIISAVVNFEV